LKIAIDLPRTKAIACLTCEPIVPISPLEIVSQLPKTFGDPCLSFSSAARNLGSLITTPGRAAHVSVTTI
jgi:hypothetical protein